jgi:hypothetical protein
VEARAFYASCGFIETAPATATPGPFQDHWFEKTLTEPNVQRHDGRYGT